MSRQLDLLGKPPRKRPRVLMHVCDAGGSEISPIVQFECATCGYRSGWLTGMNVSTAKRGLPCPKCQR